MHNFCRAHWFGSFWIWIINASFLQSSSMRLKRRRKRRKRLKWHSTQKKKIQKNEENVRLKIFIYFSHIFMNKYAPILYGPHIWVPYKRLMITIIITTIAAIDIDSEMIKDLVEGSPGRWRSHQPSRRAPPPTQPRRPWWPPAEPLLHVSIAIIASHNDSQ